MGDLAGGIGISRERISRLKSRVIGSFEEIVNEATRPGRPRREPERSDDSLVLRQLLALVPREVWTELSRTRQQALVAAQERLNAENGLTQARFCELLGIPERTFRSWKERKDELPPDPRDERSEAGRSDRDSAASGDDKRKKKRRPKATGRFDLTQTAPETQLMTDTSRWQLFGVPLYIVSVQDPGWRKQRLWESFSVDEKEDSELIVRTIEQAARSGLQVISDQGTPYMSEYTRRALESLECEHAPQKEGAPTEKSPEERAFRTVKEALEPLSALSNKIAELVPAFHDGGFARAVGRRLLQAFLRVYEAAPREGGHPLAERSAEELAAIIEEQREKARAEFRSVRLTLTAIHRQYGFPGTPEDFIRAHRDHALEDIHEAERRLRVKAGTAQIKCVQQYFAGILRNVREEKRPERARKRKEAKRQSEQRRKRREERSREEREKTLLRDQPEVVLAEGLDMIDTQWLPDQRTLFARGHGYGERRLREALLSMQSQNAYTVADRAQAIWTAWEANSTGCEDRLCAVRQVFEDVVAEYRAGSPPGPQLSQLATASAG